MNDAAEPLEIGDVRVRRRRVGGAFRLAFLLVVFGMFGMLMGFTFIAHASLTPIFLAIPFVLFLALIVLRRRAGTQGEERGALRVDRGEITLDGARVVSTKEIESAWVAPHTATNKVLLRPKRGLGLPFELFVHREEDARAIVRTLGLDVDRTTARVDVRSPYAGGAVPALILLSQTMTLWRNLVAPHGPLPSWTMPLWIALLTAWVFAAAKSRTVIVGRDGIRIRWLGRERFIPHRDVARVDHTENAVNLRLVSGEKIDLTLRPKDLRKKHKKQNDDEVRDETLGLADRIERAATRDDEASLLPLHALDPQTRSVAEWVASVRKGDGVRTFRDGAPLDDAQLWRVVEDGGVDHAQRAAAAIALSRSLDDVARARLRVAAGASAEPKLRVALEAAAEEDEPKMTRALERLRRRR